MNDDDYNYGIYNKYVDYTERIAGVDFSLTDDFMKEISKITEYYKDTHLIEEKVLYAVKEQIHWAHKTYMNHNEDLNSTEKSLLRKVIEDGSYTPSDRGLLNELLKKY